MRHLELKSGLVIPSEERIELYHKDGYLTMLLRYSCENLTPEKDWNLPGDICIVVPQEVALKISDHLGSKDYQMDGFSEKLKTLLREICLSL